MAVFKTWIMEWVLKNPWLVRVTPGIFHLQFYLGKLYQFAGLNDVAYRAFRKAIVADPGVRTAYQAASRLPKTERQQHEWLSFLRQLDRDHDKDSTLPALFLLQDDPSLSGNERISLILSALEREAGNTVLVENLVREYVKLGCLEDLVEHGTNKYVTILSPDQCLKLLDDALLLAGIEAYEWLQKHFSSRAVCINDLPNRMAINHESSMDLTKLHKVIDQLNTSDEVVKQWLKVHYFTQKMTDDELFHLAGKHQEWEEYCVKLALAKAKQKDDSDLFIRCCEYLLSMPDEKITRFDLQSLGMFLQKINAYTLAIRLYKRMGELSPDDPEVINQLSNCLRTVGDLREALLYARKGSGAEHATNVLHNRKADIIQSELNLLEAVRSQPTVTGKNIWDKKGIDRPILHVLNNSFPYSGNGYAVRSKYIVDHQARLGLNPVVVTRLGFPTLGGRADFKVEKVGGVPYYRLQRDIYSFSRQPITRYLNRYEEKLVKVVKRVKPRIIHAASNFYNGYPAWRCARRLGVPFVYELRGFWEMSRGAIIAGYNQSEKFKIHHQMELHLLEQADSIVTISASLKEYMVARGVNADKITVVPNAVDTYFFKPRAANERIMSEHNLMGKTVIGFVGSVTAYEGLDVLLRAVKTLDRTDVVVMIVGSGAALTRLKALARQLGIDDQVIFTGRVPFEKVRDYYSVIDIFPFPRIPVAVCELVTPLKPFEAMAMEKTVLVSKLGALTEMVHDGSTGLHFNPEDTNDLADKLEWLISEPGVRRQFARKGRRWVVEHRDWRDISQRYVSIYKQLS